MSRKTRSSKDSLLRGGKDGRLGAAQPAFLFPSQQAWSENCRQVYPAGVELCRQDDRAREVYWIEQGFIKLVRIHRDGREMILDVWGTGRALGLAAAILQLPVPITAVTLTPCHLLRIPIDVLCGQIERLDDVSRGLLQIVSREAYEQTVAHAAMGLLRARERCEWLLEQLVSALGSAEREKGIALALPLRQWELAEMLAIRPEHLSRLLREMEREGVVRRNKGRVILTDPRRRWPRL